MKTLFFLSLFASVCYAQDIKLAFNINGASCGHIQVLDSITGKVISVSHEQVIMALPDESDTEIIKAIKQYIQDNNLTLAQFKKIKTNITLAIE